MFEDLILGPRYYRYQRIPVQRVDDGDRVDFSKANDSMFDFLGNNSNDNNSNTGRPDSDEPSAPPLPGIGVLFFNLIFLTNICDDFFLNY